MDTELKGLFSFDFSNGTTTLSSIQFGTNAANETMDPKMDPTCTPPEFPLRVYEQVFIIIMYGLVSLFAIAGNAIVCYIVIAFDKMRKTENIFLFNLALTDIVMAVLCVPFTFVPSLIMGTYPFGLTMCKLMNYSQIVSVLVSSYTLVAISVERYMGIVHPFRLKLTRRKVITILVVIWLSALIVALPTLIYCQLVSHHIKGSEILQCVERWPETHEGEPSYQSYIYGMVLMATQYFLPVGIMVFTYTTIAVHVWGTKTPGEALKDRDKKIKDEKTRMTKMMVVVVLSYIVSWLPLNVYNVIADNKEYSEVMYCFKYIHYIWFACHWLAMSHSIFNPLIYYWMNTKFRAGFIYALNFIFCCRRLPDQYLIDNKLISGHLYTSVKNGSAAGKLDFPRRDTRPSLPGTGNGLHMDYRAVKANGKVTTNGKVTNGSVKRDFLPTPILRSDGSSDSRTLLKDNEVLDVPESVVLLPDYPVSVV